MNQGSNTIMFPNGNPYIKCNIRDNKQTGPYEEYYENGLIKHNGIIMYNYFIGSSWFYHSNNKTKLYIYDRKTNTVNINKKSEYLNFSYIRYDINGIKTEEKIKNVIGYTHNLYNNGKLNKSINYFNNDNYHLILDNKQEITIINKNNNIITLDYYNSNKEITLKLTGNNLLIYDKFLNIILHATFKDINDIHEPDIILELNKNVILKKISRFINIFQNNLNISINTLDNNKTCEIILKCIDILKNHDNLCDNNFNVETSFFN